MLTDRRRAVRPGLPPVWAVAPPRFVVLGAGFVVAAVATPFSEQQTIVSAFGLSWVLITVLFALRYAARAAPPRADGWVQGPSVAAVDAALVIAAIVVSGGAHSPLRWLLVAAPACWALARDPRVGRLGLLGAVGYFAASVNDIATGRPETLARIVGFYAVYGGAILIARQAVQSQRREAALQAAVTEEREKSERRLIEQAQAQQEDLVLRLHDGPLQLALTVHQDLEEFADGEEIDLEGTKQTLRDAIKGMRTLSGELYSSVLADAGLAGALRQIAGSIQQRGGPPTRIDVGVHTAGAHDELVLRIVRELLINVQKHAQATEAVVSVALRGQPEELLIVVSDDGVGMNDQDRESAAQQGHIGLASIGRNVTTVGGTVEFQKAPRGTAVCVRLPTSDPGRSLDT